jgi:phage-related baseplate assembly protein
LDLPNIIETPDFQAKLKDTIERFTAAYQKVRPEFQAPTPADPLYHLLVELVLVSVIGTEKINNAAYTQLVKLSNEIDFIFKGKIREGESYESYRDRMRGTRDLASPAGTDAMYKALTFALGEAALGSGRDARTASVMDAFVQNVKGELFIHVLVNSDAADLKKAVLDALAAAFKKETVKPALDKVTFLLATPTPFVITASITLQPGYTAEYKATIEQTFRARFEANRKLGWMPTVSWIIKELHQPGVKSVIMQSPVSNIPVQPERYASISRLDLSVEVPG